MAAPDTNAMGSSQEPGVPGERSSLGWKIRALAVGDALRDWHTKQCDAIREQFNSTGDGLAALAARTQAVDALVERLWHHQLAPLPESAQLAVVALGGYGRKALYPHSDIDLLFLFGANEPSRELRDAVRSFSQHLWDLRLRLSPSSHNLQECGEFRRENAEFTISLLDCRYLCGSRELFTKLHDTVVPQLIAREHQELVHRLTEINEDRHAKFGDTIFHLEPNIKDGPGGLRDFNIANWLTQIQHFSRSREWIEPRSQWALSVREGCERAYRFLAGVRCFLHYRANRDENTLAWDAQEEAAKRSLGSASAATSAAEWMRAFFREARVIYRISQQVLDDVPAQQSSLYKAFQSWRGRVSNADFSAVKNRVYLQQPSSIGDPDVLLRCFEFCAQHGIPLATSTERRIEQAMPQIAASMQKGGNWWPYLRNILQRPHAGLALRAMHDVGVLTLIIPEFHYVDALVIRDLYHRYTVDEHTFAAIDSLHQLVGTKVEAERGYAGLFSELEHRELLMLAVLLHDLGKGTESENHVQSSVEFAKPVLDRFGLEQQERELVLFLISAHLEMSAALRRDIFDVPSVRAFAHVVGNTERLKMLCLMTWADIRSVNPDALTPWKAENIWQLYIATANILSRSLDDERIHADREDESLARIRALAPRLGRRLKAFLEGLPQRYLSLHSAHEIMQHIELASTLQSNPVQTALKREGSLFQLTLVTMDKPMIFANVAGALASWGMNIQKADAFSNAAGVVVDTFLFTDRFRTLELNVQEWERFQQVIEDVLSGRTTVEKLMQRRRPEKKKLHVAVETSITLDDQSSPNSTLIEIVTEDRPGLLYLIARRFSLQKCNIEVALIDTQGQMAIDVFYLTRDGQKLSVEEQKTLRDDLMEDLQS